MSSTVLKLRQTQVLYDQKWRHFLRYSWLFKYIPFIDGVFGNGSMAIGNVSQKSDFDVLILARENRIFTARAFAIIFFGLLGVRRSKHDSGADAADKVCLNHFLTKATFRLTEKPNNFYRLLYRKLVPVYGSSNILESFFKANQDWLEVNRPLLDNRLKYKKPSWFKLVVEKLLKGALGAPLESALRKFQVRRIEKGLPRPGQERQSVPVRVIAHSSDIANATYSLPPLIKYNKHELQFHPDPAIIEIRSTKS